MTRSLLFGIRMTGDERAQWSAVAQDVAPSAAARDWLLLIAQRFELLTEAGVPRTEAILRMREGLAAVTPPEEEVA